MIVYNAGRRWFPKKEDAQLHAIQIGQRGSTIAIRVEDRETLASLLNALCEPPLPGQAVPPPATPELVDRAFVAIDHDIPDYVPRFLLSDEDKKRWDERHLKKP